MCIVIVSKRLPFFSISDSGNLSDADVAAGVAAAGAVGGIGLILLIVCGGGLPLILLCICCWCCCCRNGSNHQTGEFIV